MKRDLSEYLGRLIAVIIVVLIVILILFGVALLLGLLILGLCWTWGQIGVVVLSWL